MDLLKLSCKEAARHVRCGDLKAAELVAAVLQRIKERDPTVGAFLRVDEETAHAQAAAIDADPVARRKPLAGVPIALKDNLCVEDQHTTAGSRILEPFIAPYSATVLERLLNAGAICVGKTNMDEFAMGSSTENSALGRTRNPHDPERVPGGSSGGSAAAVASEQVPAALGSDTGGSIRIPAAFCGVVGLKPTYGRVSRYGLIAFASSLDQIGPLTHNVDDTALLLGVIAGGDRRDSTAIDLPVPGYVDSLSSDPDALSLGVPSDWLGDGLDDDVRSAIEITLSELEGEGVRLVPVSLPHQEYAVATYYVIATAETSSNLARYEGVRYGLRAGGENLEEMLAKTRSRGFGAEVKRRILLGTYVLSAGYYDAYYGRAQRVRTLIRRDFESVFERVDAIVGPTTPTTAFRLDEKIDDPLAMYLSDVYTVPANLAGLPAISVPCGRGADDLPIGFQILGPPFGEQLVLQVAKLVEQLRGVYPSALGT